MVRVESVLDSWKSIRADTAQAVEDMPAGEMDFKATPEIMSFRDLALHILQASQGLTGMLLAGVDNLQTADFRERLKQYFVPIGDSPGQAELASGLRTALEARAADLATRTPEFWAGIITRFDGQRVTRLEMLQMIKEHELTHRSQMFMCLRLKGIVPSTTRRRQAARQ